jgi:type VI secretion system secreted protein Hcp
MPEAQTKSVDSLVRRPLLAAAVAVSAVAPAPAIAAADVYMKIGTIEGESTDEGRNGWIDLLSVSAAIDRSNDANGRAAVVPGKPSCSPLLIRKTVDKASPPLLDSVMTLKSFPSVDIEFVRAGNPSQVYLKFELENVQITSYQFNGAADTATESLALNFSKMTESHYGPGRDGSLVETAASAFCTK